MKKVKVGILGATGMVGQRFIELLENHPWFEVSALAASERSAGKCYREAIAGRWKLESSIPSAIGALEVTECVPELDCTLVFSALDASIAEPVEQAFAKAGYVVSSNSRNHRMEKDVPLLIPEVNGDHLAIVTEQKKRRQWKGFIVTNPNCSTIGLVLALAPLHKKFTLKKIMVTTFQALSGAGYPGVASMDIIDNVIPYIGGEEMKMETEPQKILGRLKNNQFVMADIAISASCNRVGVSNGHLESVSIELEKKPSLDELMDALREFNPLAGLNLPSAPSQPIVLREENDRPQPRYDRNEGNGMACVAGRIRECPILDWKMSVLSHNTIRGAAGAAILNAEYMKVKGLVG
ncbi:MAG: aspartate-semialdehyde dehydrogenase [Deltaproteobacteria bacterium]|nr:aspartate-semialdehyde dehydrogenase [Deltaproteobacteria bacterium]